MIGQRPDISASLGARVYSDRVAMPAKPKSDWKFAGLHTMPTTGYPLVGVDLVKIPVPSSLYRRRIFAALPMYRPSSDVATVADMRADGRLLLRYMGQTVFEFPFSVGASIAWGVPRSEAAGLLFSVRTYQEGSLQQVEYAEDFGNPSGIKWANRINDGTTTFLRVVKMDALEVFAEADEAALVVDKWLGSTAAYTTQCASACVGCLSSDV
jgi:hypothetical protein